MSINVIRGELKAITDDLLITCRRLLDLQTALRIDLEKARDVELKLVPTNIETINHSPECANPENHTD